MLPAPDSSFLLFVICHLSCASPLLPLLNFYFKIVLAPLRLCVRFFKTKVLIPAARSSYHLSEQQYEQSTSIGWHQERCIHSDG
ncbi:MAG: hypothetical protein QOH31_2885 [Verrucomicrobiota bacterium]